MSTVDTQRIDKICYGYHKNPHSVLGMHLEEDKVYVRAYNPNSETISVKDTYTQETFEMTKIDDRGFFECIIPDRTEFFKYELVHTVGESIHSVVDPYCFWPTISDYDLYLFNQGNHHKIYEKMGCHLMDIDGVKGASFVVWAPTAKRVSVIGDFNQWDGRIHQMRMIGASGVWELFIPGIEKGAIYKYEIKTPFDEIYIKSDPYAFYAEVPPNTASIVYDMDNYSWNDSGWIEERNKEHTFDKPVNIYEVHLGSWMQEEDDDPDLATGYKPLSYKRLTETLIPYVKEMGYTHIELMPVAEHPFDGSWGYQVTGYYAPTSRFGKPEDLKEFIDICHQNDIGVILDWVPAHFPKDGHGLARFDGTAVYEYGDKRKGEHLEWGTHVFNFGRNEVKNFLISNAIYWFDMFHFDGLRVDAVASMLYLDYCREPGEWIPNQYGGRENLEAVEFIKHLNTVIYQYHPTVMMIAEESTAWPMVTKPVHLGGLGFTHKWNMGWMNDFLRYISLDPIYRRYHQNLLTFSFMYAWSENFILVLSHDEVVHGKGSMINKMPGDYWQKFAGLRCAYGYLIGHPGKKLLFMGGENGQFAEWKYQYSLDWHLLEFPMHKKLNQFVKDLNHLYKTEKALHEVDVSREGFQMIDCKDVDHSIISFIRKGKDPNDMLIFVYNFTPMVHEGYLTGAPLKVKYREILNSDDEKYGGSHVVNSGLIQAEDQPMHEMPYSMKLRIPPLGVIVLRPVFED